MQSQKFDLSLGEAGKGLAVAIFSTILPSVMEVVNSGAFPSGAQWLEIGRLALGAGSGYVIQKFLRNSSGQLFKAEPKNPETTTL